MLAGQPSPTALPVPPPSLCSISRHVLEANLEDFFFLSPLTHSHLTIVTRYRDHQFSQSSKMPAMGEKIITVSTDSVEKDGRPLGYNAMIEAGAASKRRCAVNLATLLKVSAILVIIGLALTLAFQAIIGELLPTCLYTAFLPYHVRDA